MSSEGKRWTIAVDLDWPDSAVVVDDDSPRRVGFVYYEVEPVGESASEVERLEKERDEAWRNTIQAKRQYSELVDAGEMLADLAAAVGCEPRRFLENESGQQQALGKLVAEFRLALADEREAS